MIERESKNTHQMGLEGEILTSSIFFLQDNKGLLFFSKGVNKMYQKKKTKNHCFTFNWTFIYLSNILVYYRL